MTESKLKDLADFFMKFLIKIDYLKTKKLLSDRKK